MIDLRTDDQAYHWEAMSVPEAVMSMALSGDGSCPSIPWVRLSCEYMLLRSVRRAESRALAKYPFMEIKPMVQSMVSMVMTTMSSINVKPYGCLLIQEFFIKKTCEK